MRLGVWINIEGERELLSEGQRSTYFAVGEMV